jgi:hypothetical protein
MEKQKFKIPENREELLNMHEDILYNIVDMFTEDVYDFKTFIESSPKNNEKLFEFFAGKWETMNVFKVEGVGETDFNLEVTLVGPRFGYIVFVPKHELEEVFTMEIVKTKKDE